MKRLTEADIDCEITEYDNKEDIYIKLSRYEDTELEPDEVDSLKEYVETLEEARKHSKFQLDVKKDELAKANNQIKELRDAFYTIHNIINQKKDLKYENEIIDISDMDREVAILIYEDKIYEDSNHQYALESALNKNEKRNPLL